MLAISVWLAVRDAVSSLADYRLAPNLDAPATPRAYPGRRRTTCARGGRDAADARLISASTR